MKKILIYIVVVLSVHVFSCKKVTEPQINKNDFQFVFMTDIHLQPELNAVQGFNQAIDSVNKIAPDFVITGGDLIMDALGVPFSRADSLYNLYKETTTHFKMPVYNTIGNHDLFGLYKESGVNSSHEYYAENLYEKRLSKRFYSFSHKGIVFFNLDAIEDTHQNSYIGKIDSVQLLWLKKSLDTIQKTTPIVITTHIPFITSMPQVLNGSMITNIHGLVVENSKEVLDLFKGYNLKLVLQGHLHFYEDIFVNNIHFVTGGAVSAKWWEGSNNGLEEGFLIVKVKDGVFSFEYKDYGWNIISN
ncbi:MAG: metallophosphoesterase [Bacteroidales bacterium]